MEWILAKREKKMFQFISACACCTGKVRKNNEDNFLFDGKFLPLKNNGTNKILTYSGNLIKPQYFAVFDGMGGEARGEEAAFIAANALKKFIDLEGKFKRANLDVYYNQANRLICSAAKERQEGIMGSTAPIVKIFLRKADVTNLGDSRVYLCRRGKIRQLSTDHTNRKLLDTCGLADRQPDLTQHLGIPETMLTLKPSGFSMSIRSGDSFLICSDGITDMVNDHLLEKILSEDVSPEEIVKALLELAMANGGKDNATVIACKIV